MKKYIGIVKKYCEYMGGLNIRFLSKTYDDKELINEWFNLYPNCEHVMLFNTEELDYMFKPFRDMTPITQEEKQAMERAKALYKGLMSEDNIDEDLPPLSTDTYAKTQEELDAKIKSVKESIEEARIDEAVELGFSKKLTKKKSNH